MIGSLGNLTPQPASLTTHPVALSLGQRSLLRHIKVDKGGNPCRVTQRLGSSRSTYLAPRHHNSVVSVVLVSVEPRIIIMLSPIIDVCDNLWFALASTRQRLSRDSTVPNNIYYSQELCDGKISRHGWVAPCRRSLSLTDNSGLDRWADGTLLMELEYHRRCD
jgi:hypothetical protein